MVPGRMILLATLFLVLVTIFNSVATITPKVKGLTAIEAWMLACILFLFGAFIEYAVILFKKQRENFKYEMQKPSPANHAVVEEYWRIDKFSLIAFSIIFFIFNIIYWLACFL